MMKNKKIIGILVCLLFFGANIVSGINIQINNKTNISNCRNTTLYVGCGGPGSYGKIKDAIAAADPYDTVFVCEGIYYENVDVNKPLFLIGENKHTTIIDGQINGDVVKITHYQVYFYNFTIRNSGKDPLQFDSGIKLINANKCNITNNIIFDNIFGIYLDINSNSNIIYNNTIKENGGQGEGGITVLGPFNIISNNNITQNVGWGIYLDNSQHNTIIRNNVTKNDWYGIMLIDSNYNVITKNSILGLSLSGITLIDSSYTLINCNNISENRYGISIDWKCEGNFIYHNNFMKNIEYHAYYFSNAVGTNKWDNGRKYGGNYWDDYKTRYPNAGIDLSILGSYGIFVWSTPYEILGWTADKDEYPLVFPSNCAPGGIITNQNNQQINRYIDQQFLYLVIRYILGLY